MNKRYEMKLLKELGDNRGNLNVIESCQQVPFEIKRMFYNYNSTNTGSRGNHANKNSSFAFISVAGSCAVAVDDGVNKEEFLLDNPQKLLIIDKLVWKEMRDFSKDNVLLVLSDHYFDASEYVDTYEEFQELLLK